jgi:hypothetical protein
MILERQEKHNEALKVLQGPLGDKFLATNMWDRSYRVLRLLTNSGQHDLVINRCLNLLQQQLVHLLAISYCRILKHRLFVDLFELHRFRQNPLAEPSFHLR